MSGHVFHPGHAELHGVTVVLETRGPVTYVGRYDHEDESGVHMLDVGIHDEANGSKTEYIQKTAEFGVRPINRHIVVPADEVLRITRLGDMA